jgi:hypothetical protein
VVEAVSMMPEVVTIVMVVEVQYKNSLIDKMIIL